MVILLTGYRGSGKSSVALEMKNQGWQTVSLGDLIRASAIGTGMSAHTYGDHLRRLYGPQAVARLVEEAGVSCESQKLLIDGVYMQAECAILRAYFRCPVFLVALVVDVSIRVARLQQRGREDDVDGVLEALERRNETLEIHKLIDEAALVIANSVSSSSAAHQIDVFASSGRTV